MNKDNSKNPAETEQGNIEPILKYNNMSKEKTLEDAIKALEKALDEPRLHPAKAYNRKQKLNIDLAEAVCKNATDTLISLSAKYPCLLADPLPQCSNPIVRMTEILRRFKKARVKKPAETSQGNSDNGGNKETSSDFFVKNGQVFYERKDLGFPAGQIQEFFEKLVASMGLTVKYTELEQIATVEKIRGYKSHASKILKEKSVPYEITALTNEGYVLRPIIA